MRSTSLAWIIAVAVIACACADAPTVDPGDDAGWEIVLSAGAEGHGADSYWDAQMAVSDAGILILANHSTEPDAGYVTWFSEDGVEWVQGRLDPPGGFTGLYVSVVVDTPETFVVAGIANTDAEGDQEVAIWETDGRVWTRIDAAAANGVAALVSGFLRPMCICGSLGDVASVADGYVAVGQNDLGEMVVWQSGNGESWNASAIGRADGESGTATAQLGGEVYVAGMAPGIAILHLEQGVWEPVARGDAFGLPAVPIGAELNDNAALYDALLAGGTLGMTAHAGSLYSLLDIASRYGEDSCDGPIAECNHTTLGLFQSDDGVSWQRLDLPERMRWNDHGAQIGSFEDGLFVVETGDGVLQVWRSQDPSAGEATPETDGRAGALTAIQLRLEDEVGGFSSLDLVQAAMPEDLEEPLTVGFRGRQTEVTVVLDLADEYVLEDEALAPRGESMRVALPYEVEHSITVDLTSTVLDPGLHEFDLEIPAWINPTGTSGGAPMGHVVLTVRVNYFDEERASEVAPFCETAIPLVDGQVPTTGDFEMIVDLSATLSDTALTIALLDAVEQVKGEIARPLTQGYDTGPLVGAVSDICGRYDLFSVAGIS